MSTPLQRLRCQYDGDFYLMDLSRDRFVHFTTRGRAAEIMESGRLLMRPPYKKFGIDAVAAVSTVWGSFLPGVQTTHIDADKRDLVGVVFQTKVMPEVGYPEEVLWKQDVVLVNPKVVPYAQAKGMIRGSSDFDGQVYYAVPSWCDGVEGRVASLSGFMSEYQRDTAEPENPRSRHHRVWWDEHYECAIHTEIVDQKGRAHLKIIQIEDPDCKGRGRAADVMKRLVRMADRHKIEMSLNPEAVGGKHINTSGLRRWYQRLGFYAQGQGFFKEWVREPGGMPPVDDAKWEVLIERPSGDEVFDYYAESFDEARDHAYSLSIDPTFIKDGEATAFRRDGGRWRKIASASRVASRVASRYTPAESAAISLLQDAPDESVEDLIEQVLRARRLFDPVSRTFVDAKEVAEALRGMAPEPYKVPGGVSVYHATDASTARLLTRRGFIPQTKPRNLTDTYAPGRGIDRGLYVGMNPRSVEGYGRVTLEVTVPRKHLSVPTELTQLGETSPMKALKSHDGAVINHPIPADAFRAVRGRLASNTRVARVSPRIKEAIEESMANLPDRLRQAVDIFSAGVIMGKAPSLEQHTSALYKAFAPLRDALGGTTTVYRGQPINPPKIERTWLSWTTEPRMAARFTGNRGYQIIEAKVKSSDVVAGILSPRNPNYIEFLVKNRPEYQTRSQKQVPIYYALDMPLNPRFYDDMPENFSDLSDREQLEFSYPGWKRWLKDNGKAVERAGGLVMHNDPPTMNPDEKGPFLGVLMPADVELPPALAALDDAKYGRPMPRYMGKVASAARVASRYAATTPLPPSFPKTEIGLMTMDEFLAYRNPQGKFHEAETWDYDVMKMNRPKESRLGEAMGYTFDQMWGGIKVSEKDSHSAGVPTLAGVIHNGTLYYSNARDGRNIPDFYFGIRADKKGEIEIRGRKQVKYLSEVLPRISPVAKRNVQKYPVILQRLIVKGEPMTLRAESQPGSMAEASTLVILNSEDLVVAQASDEWGATLIAVAREYRGRGLGKIIGKRWYELNPSNTSGGFTSAGQENALALWRDRVREFKARGWYSEMIREGRITMDRLKDIFKGVEDSKRDLEEFKALYFSEREPEPTKPTGDILVWSDGDSAVIVYDRAFLEDPDDRFIYGHGFLRSSPHTGTYIFSIDYDRPYAEMTTKALMQVARDGGDDRLYDGEGYSDIVEAENFPGVERDGDYLVLTRDLFPLRQEARKEKRLRKSVDPYDEKVYLLQEQADSKWR